MNEALYQAGANYLVFCATRKVRALLKMLVSIAKKSALPMHKHYKIQQAGVAITTINQPFVWLT